MQKSFAFKNQTSISIIYKQLKTVQNDGRTDIYKKKAALLIELKVKFAMMI